MFENECVILRINKVKDEKPLIISTGTEKYLINFMRPLL